MTTQADSPTPDEAVPAGRPLATAAWADFVPRQFVDNTWLRWWPVAAGVALLVGWLWLVVHDPSDFTRVACSGSIVLVVLAFFALMMERSIRSVTVDNVGVHARHGLGATTHLLWERITDINGGGRYGPPLALISPDKSLGLHRRLTEWPELYALVQQARPEFWTRLDPSRLKSSVPALLALALILQLPNALVFATGSRPVFGTIYSAVIVLWLVGYLFFLIRSIALSADGLRVKFLLYSRFVPKADVAGFIFEAHPFWRRGVKVQRQDGRKVNLGIMACGETYMLAVLNDWLAGGVGNESG
jgi:hypothetical protein